IHILLNCLNYICNFRELLIYDFDATIYLQTGLSKNYYLIILLKFIIFFIGPSRDANESGRVRIFGKLEPDPHIICPTQTRLVIIGSGLGFTKRVSGFSSDKRVTQILNLSFTRPISRSVAFNSADRIFLVRRLGLSVDGLRRSSMVVPPSSHLLKLRPGLHVGQRRCSSSIFGCSSPGFGCDGRGAVSVHGRGWVHCNRLLLGCGFISLLALLATDQDLRLFAGEAAIGRGLFQFDTRLCQLKVCSCYCCFIPTSDTDIPMTSVLSEIATGILGQEQSSHEKDIEIHEDIDPRMQFKDGSHHIRAEPVEDIEIIYVDGLEQQKSLRIGANLQEPLRSSLIQFLQSNTDVFAWKHEDMKGIDPQKACHRLNLDKTVKPVIQKRRKFSPDRQKALEEEVNKLIDNKFVKEAKYPTWISNPVLVKKATGLWRLCIDFSDLNQACPKDSYPIPHIDYMVDATSGHQLMSFLDAYSGYNQIPMHPDDAEHTSFYSARGLYCYVMMTFGLKNAGATYQRLVNKMFARLIGHTMEVYVDDMLVKSEQAPDHIAHLSEVFDILREYSMVLNPKKCTFGVGSGKFLGYMVSQRGIEANPAKIQAILDLAPPTSLKGVQALTGRLAALNRFISKSTDHCKPFFDAIKKKKPFEWTVECQNAFDNIKQVLLQLPTLQKPLPDEPLYLYLGVSNVAVSAVLIRQDGLQQFPVYYISKALHDAELRYPHMEKLAYALIIAARKLRPYFLEHSIV
ncbi:Uncharacterized mitochondrial protein AtMg00860, partial [Striga hermonthica]